jgi:hypothetical protein
LQGLMHTVRVLQSQLAESVKANGEKQTIIQDLAKRLRAMEKRELAGNSSKNRLSDTSKPVAYQSSQSKDINQIQIQLQTQLSEEMQKRQRAEERLQLTRNYTQQLKVHLIVLKIYG